MLIKYRTANAMDFTAVKYLIVFNTSGNGQAPYTNTYNTGYANINFVIAVGGSSGTVGAKVYQIIAAPSGQTGQPFQQDLRVSPPAINLQITAPNEFQIDFDRRIFFGVGTTPPATTAPQSSWLVNFITTDQNSNPLDALGIGGAKDTTFNLALPVNTQFSFTSQLDVPQGATQSGVQAAQLQGGQIVNNP